MNKNDENYRNKFKSTSKKFVSLLQKQWPILKFVSCLLICIIIMIRIMLKFKKEVGM